MGLHFYLVGKELVFLSELGKTATIALSMYSRPSHLKLCSVVMRMRTYLIIVTGTTGHFVKIQFGGNTFWEKYTLGNSPLEKYSFGKYTFGKYIFG